MKFYQDKLAVVRLDQTPSADRPLMQLLQLAVVERAREDQTADGIAWGDR